MAQVKLFVFFLLLLAVNVWNWYELIEYREYYPKLSIIGPIGLAGAVVAFVATFDKNPGQKNVKVGILYFALMGVGLVLGIVNAYLMSSVF